MADDDDSTNESTPTTPVKQNQKEQEIWGVPLSTWHGLGIVAVGTISLITALKVLIPPNFTLFPQLPQVQPNINPNLNLNLGLQPNQQQPQQPPAAMRRPQLDNSVEEYETYDEYTPPTQNQNRLPSNIEVGVGVGEEQHDQNRFDLYDGEQNRNGNGGTEENDLVKSDDRALRTNEPLIKSNSGINVTIAPEVVNSQRRFMRQTYTPNNTEDVSSFDAYE